MEKHRNAHLEAELIKLRKSAVEIVSTSVFTSICYFHFFKNAPVFNSVF